MVGNAGDRWRRARRIIDKAKQFGEELGSRMSVTSPVEDASEPSRTETCLLGSRDLLECESATVSGRAFLCRLVENLLEGIEEIQVAHNAQ